MKEHKKALYWVITADGTKIPFASFDKLFLRKFEKGTHYMVSRAEVRKAIRQVRREAKALQKVFAH